MKIDLGDEVKDTVIGFRGIAVARYDFINGCTRVGVQPKVGKDGKLPDAATFDEPQLEVVKRAAVKLGPKDTGGPAPYLDEGRSGGGRR